MIDWFICGHFKLIQCVNDLKDLGWLKEEEEEEVEKVKIKKAKGIFWVFYDCVN